MDGSAKSHELFLAYDKVSLAKLEPPLVLQEFVNHGIHVSRGINLIVIILMLSLIYLYIQEFFDLL